MKVDITKGVKRLDETRKKENYKGLVSSMVSTSSKLEIVEEANLLNLPIDEVELRDKNDFSMDQVALDSLKESIQKIGLQHNLVVLYRNDKYYTISGNRRLSALKQLHKEFPEDEKYKTVPAKVCQIIGEGMKNPLYTQITEEEEELLYRECNFENRQIDTKEVILHINYLKDKVSNSEAFQKEIERRYKTEGNRNNKIDKGRVFADIITDSLGVKISKSQVNKIIRISDKKPEMLKKVINNERTVSSIYDELFKKEKKNNSKSDNKTNYLAVKKEIKKTYKYLEAKDELTKREKNGLQDLYKQVSELKDLLDTLMKE